MNRKAPAIAVVAAALTGLSSYVLGESLWTPVAVGVIVFGASVVGQRL